MNPVANNGPLKQLDDWDDFVATRYRQGKSEEEFRNYEADANSTVTQFYRQNHAGQTFDFVINKKAEYCSLNRGKKSIWEMAEYLNTLVDDSDPDTDLTQIEHLLQTAEAIRKDGYPRWFVLTGLLHDIGKVLCLYGEPQWAVVGDTFPVGCRFDERIVYHEFFADNPDAHDARFSSRLGMYEENCGLRNVKLSWGHDEYLYHIFKNYLPEPALYMIRYHSFYAWHREHAYDHLLDDHDREMFDWVRKFNPYDLYSKNPVPPDVKKLRPYYEALIAKYLPATVRL